MVVVNNEAAQRALEGLRGQLRSEMRRVITERRTWCIEQAIKAGARVTSSGGACEVVLAARELSREIWGATASEKIWEAWENDQA